MIEWLETKERRGRKKQMETVEKADRCETLSEGSARRQAAPAVNTEQVGRRDKIRRDAGGRRRSPGGALHAAPR